MENAPPIDPVPFAMAIAFVVLVRDPKEQTFKWCPAIADTPLHAMAAVGQALTDSGQSECMLVGAFTQDQVMSCKPLFEQMDLMLHQNEPRG